MIYLILLIGNLNFSNPLNAYENSYFKTEIESILMLQRFHNKQNNKNIIKYNTKKLDDCRCSINTIEKSLIKTFEVDICKRTIKKSKFIDLFDKK